MLVAQLVLGAAAATAIFIALAAWGAAPNLAARLTGSATIAVSGRMDNGALESSDAAAARAREILSALPGVTKVSVLDRNGVDPMIAGLIGAPPAGAEAGPPRLLAVSLRPGERVDGAGFNRTLARQGLLNAIDDHGLFTGRCERAALFATLLLGAALLACLAGCVWLSGRAAAARVDRGWERLDLLARLGARRERLTSAIALPSALASLGAATAGAALALAWGEAAGLSAAGFAVGRPPMAPLAAIIVTWWALVGLGVTRAASGMARRRLKALFG
jgi:hypothetical protein